MPWTVSWIAPTPLRGEPTSSRDSALYPLKFLIDHLCLAGRFFSKICNAWQSSLYSLRLSQGFGAKPLISLSLRQALLATWPQILWLCIRLANNDLEGVATKNGLAAAAWVPRRTARSLGLTPKAKSLSSQGSWAVISLRANGKGVLWPEWRLVWPRSGL